MMTEGQI